jgi:hypothetical protein
MSAEIPCSFYNINVNNNTNIALMLWITMEVAEGNYGDVVYSGVRESIRGGGTARQ